MALPITIIIRAPDSLHAFPDQFYSKFQGIAHTNYLREKSILNRNYLTAATLNVGSKMHREVFGRDSCTG